MTEMVDATHKGRRVLETVEPMQTIAALAKRAEELQTEINKVLDAFVAVDCRHCPGIPPGSLKNMRITRHLYGFCPCSWVRNEAGT
jgi:hypothetical protein